MKRFLRKLFDLPITLLYSNIRTVNEPSYYPHLPRKPWLRRWLDCAIIRHEDGQYNPFYNLYGMDVLGDRFQRRHEYIFEHEFWNQIIAKNYAGPNGNWAIVLRNKFLFWMCMKGIGISTPEILASSASGFKDLQRGKYFIKLVDGECANGVACVDIENPLDLKLPFPRNHFCIVQQPVVQHDRLAAFNSSSVNTLRIVTLRKGSSINIVASGLRIGCGDLPVDNWAKGGVFVGVDPSGRLMAEGFLKPEFSKSVVEKHPISKIKFDGYQLPFWEATVALVKKAHSYMLGLSSIGWDVAITPDGPVLIEGNDNYEISLMQAVHGGLKNAYE